MCQKVQKVPKKFPQAKFHCAAFPWRLSNGKAPRNFFFITIGIAGIEDFYLGTGFLGAADALGRGSALSVGCTGKEPHLNLQLPGGLGCPWKENLFP